MAECSVDIREIGIQSTEKVTNITRSVLALAIALKVKPEDFAKAFADCEALDAYVVGVLPVYIAEKVRLAQDEAKKEKKTK